MRRSIETPQLRSMPHAHLAENTQLESSSIKTTWILLTPDVHAVRIRPAPILHIPDPMGPSGSFCGMDTSLTRHPLG